MGKIYRSKVMIIEYEGIEISQEIIFDFHILIITFLLKQLQMFWFNPKHKSKTNEICSELVILK